MNEPKKTNPQVPLPAPQCGAFQKFARGAARATGHPVGFGVAVLSIVVWAALGPTTGFSDSWQLMINTSTTIITFLMVFLIQNTQNHDSQAMQLKLDELIRATEMAHNGFVNIEDLSPEELDTIKLRYEYLASKARTDKSKGISDLGCPELSTVEMIKKGQKNALLNGDAH